MAQYFYVLTSLPAEQYNALAVLQLYKLRWQVEMVFKCLKSRFQIDKFTARSDALTQCDITAGLILALLVEDETGCVPAISQEWKKSWKWSLWRLQSHMLTILKTMILGFLDIQRYFTTITTLRRTICEPPRKRKPAFEAGNYSRFGHRSLCRAQSQHMNSA